MDRMTVKLNSKEMAALQSLAVSEFRDFRLQAALIIRQELARRGLLEDEPGKAGEGGQVKVQNDHAQH